MFSHNQYPAGLIKLVAGQRSPVKLLNNVANEFVDFLISAILDVTVAGTKVLNRGSAAAGYTEIGISENGTPRFLLDPRVLAYVSDMAAPSARSASRAANANVQAATKLVEFLRLYFAHPYAANPGETRFHEFDPGLSFEAFVTPAANANGVDRIIKGGTAAITNPSVKVTQGYDSDALTLPLFVPTARQIVVPVKGANTDLEVELKTNHRIRAIHILQETTGDGECTDIINAIGMKGDRRRWIDPKRPWDEFVRAAEMEFGGDVYGTPKGSHMLWNFQQNGRLANVLYPVAQDSNLRLSFDCQESASGSGTSQLRITLFELERDMRVDTRTGRRLVAESLQAGL